MKSRFSFFKNSIVLLTVFSFLTAKTFGQTYCTPVYLYSCGDGILIDTFSFNTLLRQNSNCNGNPNNYILDTTVTTTVEKGNTYNISIQSLTSDPEGFGVWIDYNQNGDFSDSGEFVYSSPTTGTNFSGMVTIPSGASTGITRLRVRCRLGNTFLSTESCNELGSGETEDYNITITAPATCTDPPIAGTVVSSANPACQNVPFELSLSGGTSGTVGQTYQWQTSTDGIAFANIPGATSAIYVATQNDTTYYRCIVTCGASSNSTVLMVGMNSFSQCYCIPTYNWPCNFVDNINSFSFNTLSKQNSACNGNPNYSFDSTVTTAVEKGNSYNISMQAFQSAFGVWIDYNQNGDFSDPGEFVFSAAKPGTQSMVISGIVNIPSSAIAGLTRLRVRSNFADTIVSSESCTNFGYGEAEDYNITIIEPIPCTNPPIAGSAVTADTLVCAADSFIISLNGASSGSGQTYQWQISSNDTSWSNISGETGSTLTTIQSSDNYYRCMITCGASVPSTSVFVKDTFCYCVPSYFAPCYFNNGIGNFSFHTLSSINSGCGYGGYTLDTTTTTTVEKGSTYSISMSNLNQTGSLENFGVWIDYNRNGDFSDTGEFVFSSPGPGTTFSGTVTIPSWALSGLTRLRVRSFLGEIFSTYSCVNLNAVGEAEDYNITISEPLTCSNPPTAGTVVSSANPVCPGSSFFMWLSGGSGSDGQTYQWQSSSDGISFSDIPGANMNIYQASQIDTTYYRCVVTCGQSSNSTVIKVTMDSFFNCYCYSSYGSVCWADGGLRIENFIFNTLNSQNTGIVPYQYACNWNSLDTTVTTTVEKGGSYNFSVQSENMSIGIWIDYNQNGDFSDPGEFVYSSGATGTNFSGTVIIPANAQAGVTRLRIRASDAEAFLATESCNAMNAGETEDYNITIADPPPCTDPPIAGNVVSTANPVCQGDYGYFILSLSGGTSGTGQTYQWQNSADGISFTDIVGATESTLDTMQSDTTYYRCIVTCGTSSNSSVLQVNMANFLQCYCWAGHENGCMGDPNSAIINSVQIPETTLNNSNTGCTSGSGLAYTIYPAAGNTTAVLEQGISYPFLVTLSNYSGLVAVWIDYNQNGIYEAVEWAFTLLANEGIAALGSITIPDSALTGQTGMRVKAISINNYDSLEAENACSDYWTGESEDYIITISQGVPCTDPPIAGTVISTASSVCPDSPIDLYLTGGSTGLGQTYQWQSSPDGIVFTDIPGATLSVFQGIQSDTTYYRCVVTCGTSSNSTVVQVNTNILLQCYCDNNLHSNYCDYSGKINSVRIFGTTLENINNGCSDENGPAYSVFPASGNTTATLQQGITYSLLVTGTDAPAIISVWIDYNQNGIYEPSEWAQVTTNSIPDTAAIANITIPITALTGQTGMRVRSRAEGSPNGENDACTEFFSGETEDYIITITQGVPCINPPIAGTVVSSVNPVCMGNSFILSLTGGTTGAGQTYQWQSSTNDSLWADIPGATGANHFAALTTDLYFRCYVTCGIPDTSAAILINIQPCFCIPSYRYFCQGSGDFIDNFSFNTLSKQNSGCIGNDISYFLDTSVTTTVVKGSSYNISMQSGPVWGQYFGVWIDYNQNYDFNDSGEFVYFYPGASSLLISGVVTIPLGAMTGITRLRVRCRWDNYILAPESCTEFDMGETEDYYITIIDPFPCADTPVAGITLANPNPVLPGSIFLLSLSGNSVGTGQTFQWQSSVDNITFTDITGATSDTLTTSTSADTYYRCVITCGASEYSASVQVTLETLNAGTASGPSFSIGNQVQSYFLNGCNGNIQWQSADDGNTFTDIPGATENPMIIVSPGNSFNDTIVFRARVSAPGFADVFSNPVITIIECASSYSSESLSGDFISHVLFNTINNSSNMDYHGGNVQDFKGTSEGTTTVCQGMSYLMTIISDTTNNFPQGKIGWIDYNNNGSFEDPGEVVFGPFPANVGGESQMVTIPQNAVSDTVKMRVACVFNEIPDISACFSGVYGFGEIEEYSVIINPRPIINLGFDTILCDETDSIFLINAGSGFNSYLWSTNFTGQILSVSTDGAYSVTVTDTYGCSSSDTVNISFQICADINEIFGELFISVIPNPNNGSFAVVTNNGAELLMPVNIYNILGEKVFHSTISGKGPSIINLKNIDAGIYFMQIITCDKIYTQKIEVE